MKKISLFCFLFLLAAISSIFADPIHTYKDFQSAILSGKRFVIIADIAKGSGYFTPKAMMVVPASESGCERIVTSDLHFTDYTGQPLYEYTKYIFNPDNSVVIRTSAYDPVTFKTIGPPHFINCIFDNGVSIYSTD